MVRNFRSNGLLISSGDSRFGIAWGAGGKAILAHGTPAVDAVDGDGGAATLYRLVVTGVPRYGEEDGVRYFPIPKNPGALLWMLADLENGVYCMQGTKNGKDVGVYFRVQDGGLCEYFYDTEAAHSKLLKVYNRAKKARETQLRRLEKTKTPAVVGE